MLDTTLTKEQAEDIYNSQKQVMDDVVSWNNSEGVSQKIFIDVITEDGKELEVQGWYSWRGSKRYSFTLLYKNTISIRRWDDKKMHPDPCSKKLLMNPHKHYYHPNHGSACAYETEDVRLGDVNGALMDFLKECHISMGRAKYQMIGEVE